MTLCHQQSPVRKHSAWCRTRAGLEIGPELVPGAGETVLAGRRRAERVLGGGPVPALASSHQNPAASPQRGHRLRHSRGPEGDAGAHTAPGAEVRGSRRVVVPLLPTPKGSGSQETEGGTGSDRRDHQRPSMAAAALPAQAA